MIIVGDFYGKTSLRNQLALDYIFGQSKIYKC